MVSAASGESAKPKAKQNMGYPAFPKAGFLIKSKFQIIEKTIVIPQNLVNRHS
jgi:hypothetical protein